MKQGFFFISIFIIAMLVMVMASNVKLEKVGQDWDNVGHFKKDHTTSKYGKYEIRNSVLGIPFLQLSKVAELELVNNSERCSDCYADIPITLYNDGILIDKIIFKTLQKDGTWIEQPIRNYKISYTGEIKKYKAVCEEQTTQNGTAFKVCEDVEDGTRLGKIYYTEGDIVEAGTYYVRLDGQKKPSRSVDWIILTNGITTNEWAVWGNISEGDDAEVILNNPENASSSLNFETLFNASASITSGAQITNMSLWTNATGNWTSNNISQIYYDSLECQYRLDESSGDIIDYSNNVTNGTNVGASTGETGIIKTAYNFNAGDGTYGDHFTIPQLNLNNFTINMWLNPDGSWGSNSDTFFSFQDGSGATGDRVFYNDGVSFQIDDSITGSSYVLSNHIGTWRMYTFRRNGTNMEIFINGTSVDNTTVSTNTFSINNFIGKLSGISAVSAFDGKADEITIFNESISNSEIIKLYNSHNAQYPLVANKTKIWNLTIPGLIYWNVEACDTDGDCGFAESNYTVFFDPTSPKISVESPNGTLNYNYIGGNETLNVTFTDSNLESCSYNYNGTNITIDGCLTATKNSTSFLLEEEDFNMTIYANDSVGNENNTIISWDYKILENSQTFNNETTEGSTESFKINFTKKSFLQVSTVNLIYNDTSYSFPYSVSGNEVISESTVTIQPISTDVNITFYWNITLDDGTAISTHTNNQTVSTINIDNCSSYTNLIYNFTQHDEENQSIINDNNTIELQVNLYDVSKSLLLINFSDKFIGTNPVQVCLEDPLLTTVNYSAYVTAKYYGNTSAVNYSIEYYNILNQTITNSTVPKNIDLYSLDEDDTTKFRLTFRDRLYALAPNILVQVYRQYIPDNDFKIVEIPLTDSNGQTMLNLVKNDVVYNFIMVNESGDVIGTFNSVTAFCQDFTIGECTINLAPDTDSDSAYNYNDEFGISLSNPSYNNSTKKISITFVTDDLVPKTVRIDIVRNNDFGNRSVCSDSLTAASGTLSCDVSSIVDTDQFLFISTYVDGQLAKQNKINLNATTLNFGILNGAFFAFLIILSLICIFMEDKMVLVVSLGLGWIVVISLGLVSGKFIGAGTAGIWLLITIAIFIWKLNREEGK